MATRYHTVSESVIHIVCKEILKVKLIRSYFQNYQRYLFSLGYENTYSIVKQNQPEAKKDSYNCQELSVRVKQFSVFIYSCFVFFFLFISLVFSSKLFPFYFSSLPVKYSMNKKASSNGMQRQTLHLELKNLRTKV